MTASFLQLTKGTTMDIFIGLVFFMLLAGGVWYYVKAKHAKNATSNTVGGKGGKSSGGSGNQVEK